MAKPRHQSLIVTGGAGFIGGHLIRRWLERESGAVWNFDKLTYAGNRASLNDIEQRPDYHFVQGDVADADAVRQLIETAQPDAIVHCAAESHVDRSIEQPSEFVATNITGAYVLLEEAFTYWRELSSDRQAEFRFLNVSTDEVFGSAEPGRLFVESDAFAPNSPYAASKASAAHLCRSYWRTYGLPTITTYGSNTYGPFQFPEKLLPTAILAAQAGRSIPLYGDGSHERDWLYIADHCAALEAALAAGAPGCCYNVGSSKPIANRDLLERLCHRLDEHQGVAAGENARRIERVTDRPGHDRRYGVDCDSIRSLGWAPRQTLDAGLRETVNWYEKNHAWLATLAEADYHGRRGLGHGERRSDSSSR